MRFVYLATLTLLLSLYLSHVSSTPHHDAYGVEGSDSGDDGDRDDDGSDSYNSGDGEDNSDGGGDSPDNTIPTNEPGLVTNFFGLDGNRVSRGYSRAISELTPRQWECLNVQSLVSNCDGCKAICQACDGNPNTEYLCGNADFITLGKLPWQLLGKILSPICLVIEAGQAVNCVAAKLFGCNCRELNCNRIVTGDCPKCTTCSQLRRGKCYVVPSEGSPCAPPPPIQIVNHCEPNNLCTFRQLSGGDTYCDECDRCGTAIGNCIVYGTYDGDGNCPSC